MRTVIEDEVYNLNYERIDPVVDFKCHVPNDYKLLVDAIHHVDTHLRKDDKGLYWRVQGYLELDDLKYLLEGMPKQVTSLRSWARGKDMCIGCTKDKLEIWALMVPYVEYSSL